MMLPLISSPQISPNIPSTSSVSSYTETSSRCGSRENFDWLTNACCSEMMHAQYRFLFFKKFSTKFAKYLNVTDMSEIVSFLVDIDLQVTKFSVSSKLNKNCITAVNSELMESLKSFSGTCLVVFAITHVATLWQIFCGEKRNSLITSCVHSSRFYHSLIFYRFCLLRLFYFDSSQKSMQSVLKSLNLQFCIK